MAEKKVGGIAYNLIDFQTILFYTAGPDMQGMSDNAISVIDSNEQLQRLITDYANMKVAPEYAIMVKGDWGSGKTHFIKSAIRHLEAAGVKSLLVSLYGLSSSSAIDREIFRQIHPVLGSKAAEVTVGVLKSMVKTALKVDLDNGLSAELDLPAVDLSKYLSSGHDFVMFFDDVERSAMPPKELLGYINHFVENQGQKVVLIANEAQLLSDQDYKDTREKVVGPSVSVLPNAVTAIKNFADEVGGGRLDKFIGIATDIFGRSGYNNLRHVRQIFIELDRVLKSVSAVILDAENLVTNFIYCYLALSIEYRQGIISSSILESCRGLTHLAYAGEDGKSVYDTIINKYPGLNVADRVLPGTGWARLLGSCTIDPVELNEMLMSSSLLQGEKAPIWLRFWEWSTRFDEDIAGLIGEAIDALELGALTEPEEALQIYGVFLCLSESGVSRLPLKRAESLTRRFIRNFFDQGGIVGPESRMPFRRSWNHHVYQCDEKADGKAFDRMYNYFSVRRERALAGLLPGKNEDLINSMKDNVSVFIDAIYGRNDNYDFSVQVFIPSYGIKFARALANLPPTDSHRVREAMKYRYRGWRCVEELAFVNAVLGELKKEISRRRGRVSAKTVASAVVDFEEIQGALRS